MEKINRRWYPWGALGSVEHLARGEKIGVEAVESVEHFERGQSSAIRICRTLEVGQKAESFRSVEH